MIYKKKLKGSLILLIVLLATSFNAFSQSDTVYLSNHLAKLVVKDLVTYDGLQSEYQLLKNKIATLEQKSITLQDVVTNIQLQLDNRNQVILQKDAQIQSYQKMTEDLKKALRREARAKKIYKIGSVIGFSMLASKLLLP